jgi:hypothetical protein
VHAREKEKRLAYSRTITKCILNPFASLFEHVRYHFVECDDSASIIQLSEFLTTLIRDDQFTDKSARMNATTILVFVDEPRKKSTNRNWPTLQFQKETQRVYIRSGRIKARDNGLLP